MSLDNDFQGINKNRRLKFVLVFFRQAGARNRYVFQPGYKTSLREHETFFEEEFDLVAALFCSVFLCKKENSEDMDKK